MSTDQDRLFAQIDSQIKDRGYALIHINEKPGYPVMSLTIGFQASYGFPDLVVTGETLESASQLAFRVSTYQNIGLTVPELIGLIDIDGEGLKFSSMLEAPAECRPIVSEYYKSRGVNEEYGSIWLARESCVYPFSPGFKINDPDLLGRIMSSSRVSH